MWTSEENVSVEKKYFDVSQQKYFYLYVKNPAKLRSNQQLMQWSYCEIAKM